MRGTSLSRYEKQLQKIDDKYNLDLNFRNYESFTERDLRVGDLPTIANATSIGGLALVIGGYREGIDTIKGCNMTTAGRGLDLFDGNIARWLNQSSDMGAGVDALCDKIGMAVICYAAWKTKALPRPYIGYILAKNATHLGLTAAAAINHPDESFRPPAEGKYAMFGDNIAMLSLLYANAYELEAPEKGYHEPLRAIGKLAIATSVPLEVKTLFTLKNRIPK